MVCIYSDKWRNWRAGESHVHTYTQTYYLYQWFFWDFPIMNFPSVTQSKGFMLLLIHPTKPALISVSERKYQRQTEREGLGRGPKRSMPSSVCCKPFSVLACLLAFFHILLKFWVPGWLFLGTNPPPPTCPPALLGTAHSISAVIPWSFRSSAFSRAMKWDNQDIVQCKSNATAPESEILLNS